MKQSARYSFRGLQAFEALARRRSFAGAAEELGVTQSAVSHQLRRLAQELGETLYLQKGGSVALTEAGTQLAERLQAAFREIDLSVAQVVGAGRATVRLAVCSSFAPGWLIGRLGRFVAQQPGIDLQLRMYAQDPELTDRVADAFVTTLPTVPGFWSLQMRRELLVPVHAPGGDGPAPGRLPLITTDIAPAALGADWRSYCELAGVALERIFTGRWLQCSHYVLARDMALAGLGIALVPDFLVEGEIRAGRLRRCFPAALPTTRTIISASRAPGAASRRCGRFADWFRAELQGRAPEPDAAGPRGIATLTPPSPRRRAATRRGGGPDRPAAPMNGVQPAATILIGSGRAAPLA
ncbi:MAG: LysR substrate-binding domain-containing protein [Dongiaceae bacterium]